MTSARRLAIRGVLSLLLVVFGVAAQTASAQAAPLSKNRVKAIFVPAPTCTRVLGLVVRETQPGSVVMYDNFASGSPVYVNGDPVNLRDPDGHDAWWLDQAGSGAPSGASGNPKYDPYAYASPRAFPSHHMTAAAAAAGGVSVLGGGKSGITQGVDLNSASAAQRAQALARADAQVRNLWRGPWMKWQNPMLTLAQDEAGGWHIYMTTSGDKAPFFGDAGPVQGIEWIDTRQYDMPKTDGDPAINHAERRTERLFQDQPELASRIEGVTSNNNFCSQGCADAVNRMTRTNNYTAGTRGHIDNMNGGDFTHGVNSPEGLYSAEYGMSTPFEPHYSVSRSSIPQDINESRMAQVDALEGDPGAAYAVDPAVILGPEGSGSGEGDVVDGPAVEGLPPE